MRRVLIAILTLTLLAAAMPAAGAAAPLPAPDLHLLSATCFNETGQIALSWSAVSGADGYIIFRQGTAVETVARGSTSWTDVNVAAGEVYTYHVAAAVRGAPASDASGRTAVGPDCFRMKDIEKEIQSLQTLINSTPVPANLVLEEQDLLNGVRRWVAVGLAKDRVERYNEYYQSASSYRVDALDTILLAQSALRQGRAAQASDYLQRARTFWQVSQEYDSAAREAFAGAIEKAQEIEYQAGKTLASTVGVIGAVAKKVPHPIVAKIGQAMSYESIALGAWIDLEFKGVKTAAVNVGKKLATDLVVKKVAIPGSAGAISLAGQGAAMSAQVIQDLMGKDPAAAVKVAEVIHSQISGTVAGFVKSHGALVFSGGKWVLNVGKLVAAFGSQEAAEDALRKAVWDALESARASDELALEYETLNQMMKTYRISLETLEAHFGSAAPGGGVQGISADAPAGQSVEIALAPAAVTAPAPTGGSTGGIRALGRRNHTTEAFIDRDGSVWMLLLQARWTDYLWRTLGLEPPADLRTPVKLTSIGDVVAVDDGTFLKADGTVWYRAGRAGGGMEWYHYLSDYTFTAITRSQAAFIGLLPDGTVLVDGYAMGYDQNGASAPYGFAHELWGNWLVPGITDAVAVAGADSFGLVLRQDGTVWSWGRNWLGQLGDGSGQDQVMPVQVKGLTGVKAIAAGKDHALALKSDGTVWAWGGNERGQLGDGTTENRAVPVQVDGLTGVKAIDAGFMHSVALKTDGTVWQWGWWDLSTGAELLSPVQVPELKDVVEVSANGFTQAKSALKADGSVWDWDRTVEVAPNNEVPLFPPVRVEGLPE